MILIVAPTNDLHARCVAQHLTAANHSFHFVDSSRAAFVGGSQFRAGPPSGTSVRWLTESGVSLDLSEIRTVWYRRRYLPERIQNLSREDAAFVRQEWLEYFAGLFASVDARFVNDPSRHEEAVKPLQLKIASLVGLRVPHTLITNDPQAAREFVEQNNGKVVHKTLSPGRHRWLGTQPWRDDAGALLGSLLKAPTIFQQMVTDCRELRLTVVGQEIWAAEFKPPDGMIDGRLALDVDYQSHVLPEVIRTAIFELMRRLGLVFGTIDMKLTNEGEYVFLELNPQGQFLYIEMLADLPISRSMASLLAEGQQ